MKNSTYKILLTIMLFISVKYCIGQDVLITKKDSTQYQMTIVASSDQQLIFKAGVMNYDEISSVNFRKERPGDKDLYDRLTAKGVSITFSENPALNRQGMKVDPLIVAARQVSNTNDVDLNIVVNSIDKFRIERQTGKVLQLLGILGAAGGMALQSHYNNDHLKDPLSKQKFVAGEVYLAAGACSLIGFSMDIAAGSHLKIKN